MTSSLRRSYLLRTNHIFWQKIMRGILYGVIKTTISFGSWVIMKLKFCGLWRTRVSSISGEFDAQLAWVKLNPKKKLQFTPTYLSLLPSSTLLLPLPVAIIISSADKSIKLISRRMRLSTLFLLALAPHQAKAFAPPSKVNAAVQTSTALQMGPPSSDIILQETYGEGSRKYRRTVYTHDEWVKHRSSDRFVRNLSSIFSSGVYKSLAKEVLATVGVASFIVIWNALTGGYTDLSGVQHDALITALPMLTLPLTPFTLLSPSLGLLLGMSSIFTTCFCTLWTLFLMWKTLLIFHTDNLHL